ncbi:hypothetical protein GCM10018781_54430 [Kitasatospora indigofera]|uniref:Uncharacterized protein n=1 Tax=Kitasatospora indigofera TaxID=67307 RepID=A0A919G6V6_9ACTN|nr:hypothetical protein GCM10018781_54430 [Kitasatospora indigofera]
MVTVRGGPRRHRVAVYRDGVARCLHIADPARAAGGRDRTDAEIGGGRGLTRDGAGR